MHGSTELTVAPIRRAVGRIRINGPDEVVTARFREGTLARIKAALRDKEPQSDFIREAIERELERRSTLVPASRAARLGTDQQR